MSRTVCEDITVGRATIKAHVNSGWVLPGGGRTHDLAVATYVAVEIDKRLRLWAEASNLDWVRRLKAGRGESPSLAPSENDPKTGARAARRPR